MKKTLIFSLMLIMATLPSAAQTVTLGRTDGSSTRYAMTPTGGIWFSDDNLVIRPSADDEATTVALADVRHLALGEADGIGLAADSPEARLTLFPNPATDRVTVSLGGAETGSALTRYDMSGRAVMRRATEGERTVIDLAGLRPGVYIVNACGKNQKLIKR